MTVKEGAGILAIKDGMVLLVRAGNNSKQLNGTLAFPGGHVEPNETQVEAAAREFTEETGLTASELIDFPNNYVEDLIVRKDGKFRITFKVYLVQDFKGELVTTEETEPFWAPIEDARKMNLLGKNNKLLDAALKYLKLL